MVDSMFQFCGWIIDWAILEHSSLLLSIWLNLTSLNSDSQSSNLPNISSISITYFSFFGAQVFGSITSFLSSFSSFLLSIGVNPLVSQIYCLYSSIIFSFCAFDGRSSFDWTVGYFTFTIKSSSASQLQVYYFLLIPNSALGFDFVRWQFILKASAYL